MSGGGSTYTLGQQETLLSSRSQTMLSGQIETTEDLDLIELLTHDDLIIRTYARKEFSRQTRDEVEFGIAHENYKSTAEDYQRFDKDLLNCFRDYSDEKVAKAIELAKELVSRDSVDYFERMYRSVSEMCKLTL